jgi:hypothetical protein
LASTGEKLIEDLRSDKLIDFYCVISLSDAGLLRDASALSNSALMLLTQAIKAETPQ